MAPDDLDQRSLPNAGKIAVSETKVVCIPPGTNVQMHRVEGPVGVSSRPFHLAALRAELSNPVPIHAPEPEQSIRAHLPERVDPEKPHVPVDLG